MGSLAIFCREDIYEKKQIIFRIDETLKELFQNKLRDQELTMSEVLSILINDYIFKNDELIINKDKNKFSYISQNMAYIYGVLNEAEFKGKNNVLDRLEELECLFLK